MAVALVALVFFFTSHPSSQTPVARPSIEGFASQLAASQIASAPIAAAHAAFICPPTAAEVAATDSAAMLKRTLAFVVVASVSSVSSGPEDAAWAGDRFLGFGDPSGSYLGML